jgi:hypothetical protein
MAQRALRNWCIETSLPKVLRRIELPGATSPDRGAGGPENEREDDDLKYFTPVHRIDDAGGKRVFQHLRQARGGLGDARNARHESAEKQWAMIDLIRRRKIVPRMALASPVQAMIQVVSDIRFMAGNRQPKSGSGLSITALKAASNCAPSAPSTTR